MVYGQFLRQMKSSLGLTVITVAMLLGLIAGASGKEPTLSFKPTENGRSIFCGDQPVATYFATDEKISRPFYAHVFTQDGIAVTRTFPPKAGEPADHADMHPGIWLAFGDLSGHDFWRNKSRVRGNYLPVPKEKADELYFSVLNNYVTMLKEGEKPIAREICRHTWSHAAGGLLLSLDSELESADAEQSLIFGDQEEMGLGVRVATPLRVKDAGGEIRTSDGKRNEKEAWGKQAKWCDYSGVVDGRRIGITLMPHPDNFRESWFHVRDYGLMVANPFGRNAFTSGEKSRIEVKPGEKLRLRFGVWIHSGKGTSDKELESVYQDYVKRAGK
ncbi:MAG: PmoA family protein [Pirellulaceae bacterium]|nr:PmoA family protein [Pirellulaceae bacterium]